VTAEPELRKTAVQRSRRIVATDTNGLELVGIRIRLRTSSNQAAITYACLRYDPRSPDPRIAQLSIAAHIDFAGPRQPRSIHRTLKWRPIALGGTRPTDAAEEAVLIIDPVVHTTVALILIQDSGRKHRIILLRVIIHLERLIWRRIQAGNLPRSL